MSSKGLARFSLYSRNDDVSRNRYKFPTLIITFIIYLLKNTLRIEKELNVGKELLYLN